MPRKDEKRAIAIDKIIIDQRGRFIREYEFTWILNTFTDRYDPRRLALAIMWVCGLRLEDGVKVRYDSFKDDFSELIMPQCKPKVNCKDGVVRRVIKARKAYLPEWLREDLKMYVAARQALGKYITVGVDVGRMFPLLKKIHLQQYLYKLRKRFGNSQDWLKDIWYYEIRHYGDGTLRHVPKYRVATHACRAGFCTMADKLVGHDKTTGKLLSGHSRDADYERYTKYREVDVLRKQLAETYMANLDKTQKCVVSVNQKSLKRFI